MNIGDIKKLGNTNGEDFKVKIIELFNYNGIDYAVVEPIGFSGFTREVPVSTLKD